jgi:hypothetical protein
VYVCYAFSVLLSSSSSSPSHFFLMLLLGKQENFCIFLFFYSLFEKEFFFMLSSFYIFYIFSFHRKNTCIFIFSHNFAIFISIIFYLNILLLFSESQTNIFFVCIFKSFRVYFGIHAWYLQTKNKLQIYSGLCCFFEKN